MAFLKKHSFKIAVLALCAVMGVYLLMTYVFKPQEPLPVLKAAPAFEMTSIEGEQVSLESTSGKARIVYFYFANCPDVCPPTTYLLSQVQEQLIKEDLLGSKVEMISITFDPERDTPDAIKAFAERTFVQLGKGWHFLRGDEEETLEIAREFGVGVTKDKELNTFYHMNTITLVDQEGQIRDWINGSDEELTAEQIVAQLKRLL